MGNLLCLECNADSWRIVQILHPSVESGMLTNGDLHRFYISLTRDRDFLCIEWNVDSWGLAQIFGRGPYRWSFMGANIPIIFIRHNLVELLLVILFFLSPLMSCTLSLEDGSRVTEIQCRNEHLIIIDFLHFWPIVVVYSSRHLQ